MEELICQIIVCFVELLTDIPEILEYRWARWTFGITAAVLAGLAIYFYGR